MERLELLDLLEAPALTEHIDTESFESLADRTLLLADGSNDSRFHVWLADGRLHRADFVSPGRWRTHHDSTMMPVSLLIPNGLIYPESSDYNFVKLLRQFQPLLSFHRFDERREVERAMDWGPYRYQTSFERVKRHLR